MVLLYANRDERSVIFARELADLAARYQDRLVVVHWLESLQGLPTEAHLRALVTPYTAHEAFICGPGPFMDAARTVLKDLGLPRKRIHLERFLSLGGNQFEVAGPVAVEEADTPAAVEVTLDGKTKKLTWPRRTKLLDLLPEKGVDAPYSCHEGQCSACACRVTSGEVKMLNNNAALDGDDIAEGSVLACQSLPLTDEVTVTYE